MKKMKLNSKLNLKKITISKLNNGEMQHFVGGGSAGCPGSDRLCGRSATYPTPCPAPISDGCPDPCSECCRNE